TRSVLRAASSLSVLYPLSFSQPRPTPDLHSFPTRRSSDLLHEDFRRHASCFATLFKPRKNGFEKRILDELFKNLPGTGMRMFNRSEEHTSELQSPYDLVCRLLLEKKKSTSEIFMMSVCRHE